MEEDSKHITGVSLKQKSKSTKKVRPPKLNKTPVPNVR